MTILPGNLIAELRRMSACVYTWMGNCLMIPSDGALGQPSLLKLNLSLLLCRPDAAHNLSPSTMSIQRRCPRRHDGHSGHSEPVPCRTQRQGTSGHSDRIGLVDQPWPYVLIG